MSLVPDRTLTTSSGIRVLSGVDAKSRSCHLVRVTNHTKQGMCICGKKSLGYIYEMRPEASGSEEIVRDVISPQSVRKENRLVDPTAFECN